MLLDLVVAEYLLLSWYRKEHAFEIESLVRFEPPHYLVWRLERLARDCACEFFEQFIYLT